MSYEDDQDEITAGAREVQHLKGRLEMIEAENAELRLKLADRDKALQKLAFKRSEK